MWEVEEKAITPRYINCNIPCFMIFYCEMGILFIGKVIFYGVSAAFISRRFFGKKYSREGSDGF